MRSGAARVLISATMPHASSRSDQVGFSPARTRVRVAHCEGSDRQLSTTMVGLAVAPTAPNSTAYASSSTLQLSFQMSVWVSATVRPSGVSVRVMAMCDPMVARAVSGHPPIESSDATRSLTGAEIVVDYLVRQGVRHAAGIPGHGCWTLTDALLDRADQIRTVQVMHEQSAVHLADGYYRASGRPMLAFTSIGPGATNTVIGMATAYVDSTAVALFTGSPHTYMRGHGLLQELERRHAADNPRIFEPVVKEWWQPSRVDDLPFVLHRAWNAMTTGRPGPVLLDVPMDVQAESAEVSLPDPERREARGRPRPDADAVERAARLLREAKRPVIVAGGGAITADATAELRALAERLGAPVVTTWNGKGAIDETHPLAGQTIGDTGSTIGNALASSADVLLSVGNRFVDWSASSWRKGVTFAIPPTKLIQLDIDEREIGKNYPVEVPLVGDARAGLRDLLDALGDGTPATAYGDEIERLSAAWREQVEAKSGSDAVPMTMARAVREVQAATRPEAIVVTGAGLPQGMVKQRWVTREPRTHLTSGGFSTMGFTASRGHRRPARPPRRAGPRGVR